MVIDVVSAVVCSAWLGEKIRLFICWMMIDDRCNFVEYEIICYKFTSRLYHPPSFPL